MSQGNTQPTALSTAVDEAVPDGKPPLEELIGLLDSELFAVMRHEEGSTVDEARISELMIRFSVGEIIFGVTADQMIEVEAVPVTTFVPQVSSAVCGLANLRGEIIVVLDLGRHLGVGSRTSGEQKRRRMIVVRDACLGHPAGVLVDRVFGIGPFYRDQLSSSVGALPESVASFVLGSVSVDAQNIAMIDLQAFARSAEAETSWPGA